MKSSNGLSMNRRLDNARNLRGVHFVDPINGEFKETFQKARWKLEIPMEAAMPCELSTTQRPNNWRSWSSCWSIRPIQCVFTGRWHSGFRYKMGPSSTICKWRTQGKCPRDVVQDDNTWIQLQTVSAMYDHETYRDRAMPIYQRLKIMVTRHIGQMIRTRNSGARNARMETGVLVKSQNRKNVSVERRMGECYQWKANGRCVLVEK